MTNRAQGTTDIVIVGGGFSGLEAAKVLRKHDVNITLIDKQNYHLFLPLLYQVAIAGLSPGDIATPLRAIFSKNKNVRTVMGEVVDIDPEQRLVTYAVDEGREEQIDYDSLIIAAGSQYNYFGNDEWKDDAPGMDGLESALSIRQRILSAYEAAEQESDPARRKALMTFAIVGGGPTGVELAGAIAEMARYTLSEDFRVAEPHETKVLLIEMLDRVLLPFPQGLSEKAQKSLERLGVTVLTETKVVDVEDTFVVVETPDGESETIPCHTVMWAAGVKASGLARLLQERTGVDLDRSGRVKVAADLSLPDFPDIFVAGDMVFYEQDGEPLPGLAPVAMQQGRHAAQQVLRRGKGEPTEGFRYADRGNMATIGRAAAVADLKFMRLSGFPAWITWLFIHLMYLVGFRNRLVVFVEWLWNYITYRRGVRLIVRQRTSDAESDSSLPAE